MRDDEARWLRLERGAGETLRDGVERMIRSAIRDGALRAGVPLPSSRALATHLGVSRGVTTEAYEQLAAEGFVIPRVKAAPVVADVPASPRAASTSAALPEPPTFDLTPTTPDVTLFPARRWLAALERVVLETPSAAYDYGDPAGASDLRRALADHLGRTRGVVAEPERIIVVQGAAQGLDLLLRLLAARGGRRVAVEDPSLPTQVRRVRQHGLAVDAQPVDAFGMQVEGLRSDAVLTTPAHQFPTGAVLGGGRRRALLAWARDRDALVVEDDYDAEFRYDRQPVRAMQGLDPDRVAYLGTVSKTLAPGLRLGWLIVPAALAEEARRIKDLLDSGSPALDQLALARLLVTGEYARHVRRARIAYRERRDRLLAALAEHLPGLPVEGIAAGVHLLLRLPPGVDDVAVAAAAEELGARVPALSSYRHGSLGPGGLVIGYGRLPESAIGPATVALASALASWDAER
jgi:GntR family transcriptional regulator/MocR family aminotransferase